MKFVQKLGKALMLPVACLPICGILMGLGYAMCPSTMQGGDVVLFSRSDFSL
jgi:PTS system N-acetylglucosamine-specific IIC component